jgi:hypothetical protein
MNKLSDSNVMHDSERVGATTSFFVSLFLSSSLTETLMKSWVVSRFRPRLHILEREKFVCVVSQGDILICF